MPQYDVTTPSAGQPVDRLGLAICTPRGTSPSSMGLCAFPLCFADDAAEASGIGMQNTPGCFCCACSADEA